MALTLTLHERPIAPGIILAGLGLLAALGIGLAVATAQVDGDRGIAVVTASSDIDVGGIEVDVTGDDADDARQKGWRRAQREAWAKLGGPTLSDGQLQSLVSAVVIERERVGSKRYIATLGVIFDRQRAGRYLGGTAQARRSAPMLLIPVTISGGTELVYEQRNPWQRAWAEYQAGTSRIDYVRPSGAGGDSLLLTYGQTSRRSRAWWNTILDQFGAADVLVPIVRLQYQYPGGPVEGAFTARYGPDNRYLDSFTLTADSPDEVPAMMVQAVSQFDEIFSKALADGKLRPDPTLSQRGIDADPVLQRLIEAGRAAVAQERAAAAAEAAAEAGESAEGNETAPTPTPSPTAATLNTYVVQFATPSAGAVDATLAAVNATPGVRGAATSSLAIGGTSVMRVTYGGSLGDLAAALRSRGFSVNQGSNALAISR
ncbi:heavy-metal-associated domain-containing protein [Parerythrobacter jejuensis]|nr:heavy-metal-associated domain-containing protein [Parerythrobacter jejuensis]